jgi:hypothetical protein
MCTGMGAPGTLRKILRGYFGDYNARPERFPSDEVVTAGFIEIGPEVRDVLVGLAGSSVSGCRLLGHGLAFHFKVWNSL